MNRLASETSPYLRQHADNPVDWYPWSEEALAAARELDRPVMLSVGYSSCHWCHVMAHESFEDEQTAIELNSRFVPVKVDREERPDVDAVYMEAVQAVSGRGGWPMTVFLTPDGRPFFAGTYFPARDLPGVPGFRRVLDAVDDAWRNRREEVERQADALLDAVARRARLPEDAIKPDRDTASRDRPRENRPVGSGEVATDLARGAHCAGAYQLLAAAASEVAGRFDSTWGGFGPAPKFPHPTLVDMCIQHHWLSGDDDSLEMALRTLEAMAAGGIHDHLGGGFHRYSTDRTWTVPHFEKMLYDQAGLVRAYLHAWQSTRDPRWMCVVEETIGYVLRDLARPGGGLCSAEDADSEGEEGRFYVWTPSEVAASIGTALGTALSEWYGMTDEGNFEGMSILRRPLGSALLKPAEVQEACRSLLDERSRRPRPARDDKVLTEWNAMFGAALAEAAGATGRVDWSRAAVSIGEFLYSELRRADDGRWLRSWQDGRARHLAYSADYAWVIELFTRLSELTGDALWLDRAGETAHGMLALFSAPRMPLFTTGSDAPHLVVRPMELADGATPSGTSVAAAGLARLAALSGDGDLADKAEEMLEKLLLLASDQPLAIASALWAGALATGSVTQVVVSGDRQDLIALARRRYDPTQVLAWGQRTGSPLWQGRDEPAAYVCRRYTCQAPSRTVDELNERLDLEHESERVRFAEVLGR